MNQSIVACGKTVDIGTPVILWEDPSGFICPHKRGRSSCTCHHPALNDSPTQPEDVYLISDLESAYEQLRQNVHQCILHYDACFCSFHCHQVLSATDDLGSHFYLDLDGTIYQTCDLYWRANAAPADDGLGNHRAIHVEISNLSWEARAAESELHNVSKDQYLKYDGQWRLDLPQKYLNKIRTSGYVPRPARVEGEKGYFSKSINGRTVNMWDYTEEQYQALIKLCIGIHKLLPKIELKVPYDPISNQTPLSRLEDYSTFCGFLGHAHVQGGIGKNVSVKFDPGSAMDWDRLQQQFQIYLGKT